MYTKAALVNDRSKAFYDDGNARRKRSNLRRLPLTVLRVSNPFARRDLYLIGVIRRVSFNVDDARLFECLVGSNPGVGGVRGGTTGTIVPAKFTVRAFVFDIRRYARASAREYNCGRCGFLLEINFSLSLLLARSGTVSTLIRLSLALRNTYLSLNYIAALTSYFL